MRWLKALWRDPVLSKVIAAAIIAGLGALAVWGRHQLAAVLNDLWSFLVSNTAVPNWLVGVLAIVAVVAGTRVFARLISTFRHPSEGELSTPSPAQDAVLQWLAHQPDGGKVPQEYFKQHGMGSVVIQHAVDELVKAGLLDSYAGDSLACWLTAKGRAYLVGNGYAQ